MHRNFINIRISSFCFIWIFSMIFETNFPSLIYWYYNKHQEKFHCEYCKLNFATSLLSMLAHRKSHIENRIIKIGRVNVGNYAGSYRPHEHQFNRKTKVYGFGPGATTYEIRFPHGCIVDGHLVCRKCNSSQGPISTNTSVMSLHTQPLRASKLERHERTCRK